MMVCRSKYLILNIGFVDYKMKYAVPVNTIEIPINGHIYKWLLFFIILHIPK